MTLNRPLGLSLVAAALLAVYGCGKEEPKPVAPAAAPAMPEATVKIGHVGPTTGPQAHLGKDNENGARLAIEDANAKGVVIDGKKVKFDLVAEDDQAAGATVVAREYTNDKATDFKAILTKIKAKSPDVIMYGGMDAQGGPMVKQMKELGIKAKYIAGDGVCSAEWPKLAGGAAEGQYCTQAGLPPDKMPNAKDFVDRFTKKYGPIQVYAPYSYDAANTLIEAMKKANSADPGKYR